MRTKLGSKVLLYTRSTDNGGLVLAEKARAECVARIHRALETASTWAEFRRLMPVREYSKVMQMIDDNGEPRPRSTDAFDAYDVPGFPDGDYPPWLQQEMESVLPNHTPQEFGELRSTMLNGAFWHIDPSHLPALKTKLGELGYEVRDGSSLGAWY